MAGCSSLLAHGQVDPLWQRDLAQVLLHGSHALLILRQAGIHVLHGVLEVVHQCTLDAILAWKCGLPLRGHPVFHHRCAAIFTVLDHPVHTQGGQLGVIAYVGAVQRLHDATGQRRQEALRQQRQVSLVDFGAYGMALIQAHVGQQWPGIAVVSVDRNRIADLVQRLQQVASGGVELTVDGAGTEVAAALHDTRSLVAVDGVVVIPAADDQHAAQRRNAEVHGQGMFLLLQDARVVASQS